ncbi:ABC transporter, ATP binding protein [Streptococcus ictaluri 707-05]|uniref:ABC transporter, ATP binding protein n=1 Tax=Streptococcus ictaluri 707-05 TaxID=764299 RepID=G5K1U9_9STRE|nr:ABC transporter, ATP binding protein [Streptococcus ictaluri 707-05]
MSLAEDLCDRVLILDKGELQEMDSSAKGQDFEANLLEI